MINLHHCFTPRILLSDKKQPQSERFYIYIYIYTCTVQFQSGNISQVSTMVSVTQPTTEKNCILMELIMLYLLKCTTKYLWQALNIGRSFPSFIINSLWPSDAIWRQRSWSTLAQVMACCLTAPSHFLNQCWLIISEAQWHSYKGNSTRDASNIYH